MAFRLEFEPQVWNDLDEALDYYRIRSSVAAERLNKEFYDALDTIVSNPYYYVRYNNLRAYKLPSFPYSIYYRIEEKNIIAVFSFSNLYRDADKYPK
jgi:plasmid stabilization system protein ParE